MLLAKQINIAALIGLKLYQIIISNIRDLFISLYNLLLIDYCMQFEDYQQIITECIEKYQKADGRAQNYYNKAKNQIDLYQIYLQDSMAAQSRFKWLNNQKEILKKIQQSKMVVKDEQQVKQIMEVGDDIDRRLDEIYKDTEKAIQASTYIRIELQKQIEALDNLEDENKQFKKRIKRAKKGLQVIIRRAMMNKCTQFLMILVILAIIGLIIVSILVDKGIISVKAVSPHPLTQ